MCVPQSDTGGFVWRVHGHTPVLISTFPGLINVLASLPLQALTFLLLHIGFFFLYCREGQRVGTVLWQLY